MFNVPNDAHGEDQQLVNAAQAGSTQAFELLVDRYHDRILTYLTRQTGDPDLAADLTQDTFLDAFRDINRLTGDRTFAAWLYLIARNNALGDWKRRRRRRFISLDWLKYEGKAEHTGVSHNDRTAQYSERELVQHVLDKLSPTLRDALLLNSLIGFSSQEVASILGISPAAARQRVGRAKEEFRLHYAKLREDDRDVTVQAS